ncbi:MAG: thioesterase superfamily protein [Clostridia bacterium]|nr:thioesterase superfamily protein [Clostridia bacterium]
MKSKLQKESIVEMTELVLPNDTNLLGNLLGGRLLHWIDIAGAMAAQRHCNSIVATVAIDSVDFKHPVKVGQMVSLEAKVTWVGRTSMEVVVHVCSEDFMTGEKKFTNKAYLTFVGVDSTGRPKAVPALIVETEDEKKEFEDAEKRHAERLKRK